MEGNVPEPEQLDSVAAIRALHALMQHVAKFKQRTPQLMQHTVTGPAGQIDWEQSAHPMDEVAGLLRQIQYGLFAVYGKDHWNEGQDLEHQLGMLGQWSSADGTDDDGTAGDHVKA